MAWHVARCAHLDFALSQIEAGGFEAFAPMTVSRGRVAQLFHNYIFATPINGTIWQSLRRVVGVTTVLSGVCPDAEIAALRSRAGPDGIIVLPKPPAPRAFVKGDRVRVLAGPFVGFDGLHTGMSAHAREIILLNMLGRATRVAIDRALVGPA
jgi:transcription antitermination factor NusG